jgi:HEPN domain-containing protein
MAFNAQQHITHWVATAEADIQTAEDIFVSGKNLHFCLFICHLALEKILKAKVIQETQAIAPKIHDLSRLAQLGALQLSLKEEQFLLEMNTFNLSTRYPDYHLTLYKQATAQFTEPYLLETQRMLQWLKTLL